MGGECWFQEESAETGFESSESSVYSGFPGDSAPPVWHRVLDVGGRPYDAVVLLLGSCAAVTRFPNLHDHSELPFGGATLGRLDCESSSYDVSSSFTSSRRRQNGGSDASSSKVRIIAVVGGIYISSSSDDAADAASSEALWPVLPRKRNFVIPRPPPAVLAIEIGN